GIRGVLPVIKRTYSAQHYESGNAKVRRSPRSLFVLARIAPALQLAPRTRSHPYCDSEGVFGGAVSCPPDHRPAVRRRHGLRGNELKAAVGNRQSAVRSEERRVGKECRQR